MATANYNYIGTQPAYTIPDTWSSTPVDRGEWATSADNTRAENNEWGGQAIRDLVQL